MHNLNNTPLTQAINLKDTLLQHIQVTNLHKHIQVTLNPQPHTQLKPIHNQELTQLK